MSTPKLTLLERACTALASIVRVEYGEKYSLAHIARTWGEEITPEQIEALEALESGVFESGFKLVHDASQSVDVEPPQVGG